VTPPLFFVDDLPSDDWALLSGDEGRHAARVRRLSTGEPVLLSDGAGSVLDCTVAAVLPDGLRLTIRARRYEPVPDPRLVVVQALPKGERAELAIEILTELGADEIVPWSASRSIARWREDRTAKALAKWRRTAREAAKQSRRARVPAVAALHSSAEVANRLAAGAGLVLHADAPQPLASAALPEHGDVVVVVGPEGGIAPDELAAFTAAGAQPVRLGDPVMRTSTAGAAALAALSVQLGRWR
jgi:16S rRNA (uracil1498-N3)-methyltransferase